MEETPENNQDVTNEVNSEETQPEIDVNELQAKLDKLEQSNKRLLDESYGYKQKYNSLKSEHEERQKHQLEEQENYKELYELERKKANDALTEAQEARRKALKKDMHFKVASRAGDANDVEDVIHNLKKYGRDVLQIDEETETINGIDEALEIVRKEKPWLFKKQNSTGMVDSRPKGDNGKKSWNDLTAQEKDELFKKDLTSWL